MDAQSEEGEGLVDANNPSLVHFFFGQLSRPWSLIQSQSWRIQPEQIIILDIAFSRSCYCTSPISASSQIFLFFSSFILFFSFNPRQLNGDNNEDLSHFGVCSRGSMYSGKFCFRYKFYYLFLHLFIYQFIFKRFCYLRLTRDTISSHIWISCEFKRTFTRVLFYAVVILKKDYTYYAWNKLCVSLGWEIFKNCTEQTFSDEPTSHHFLDFRNETITQL